MNRSLPLLILILFWGNIFFGQKKINPFEISLEKEILKNVYFNFEVIDLRQRTDFLGNIYKTTSNKLMPAKLENSAVFQFQNLIKKSNKHGITTKDSFALVIKEMVVLEEYEPDQASLNVFFEFYKIVNDQYFKVHEFDGFYFYSFLFVHKLHAEKIGIALQEAIVEFQLYSNSQLLPELENGFSKKELLEQKVVYNYEILKTKNYKKGFYRTYAEFLNNSPSEVDVNINIKVTETQIDKMNLLKYKTFVVESFDSTSAKDYRKNLGKMWGFSDGKNIYINNISFNNARLFSRVESKGPYLYFLSIDKSSRNLYFNISTRGNLVVGIIVGVAGLAISKSIQSKHKTPFVFSLETQNTSPVTIQQMGLMLRSDTEVVNAYKNERRRGKKSVQFKHINIYNNKNTEKFIERMMSSDN